MNLLVNLDPITANMSGIGRFTLMLTNALLRSGQVTNFCAIRGGALLPEHRIVQLLDPAYPPTPSPRAMGRHLRQIAARIPGSRALHTGFNTFRASRALRRLHDYVYWEPGYHLLPFPGPALLTVYDLSHQAHPEFHPRSRVKQLARSLPDSIARATALLTVSSFSQQQIEQAFRPEKPITVIYPGVDDAFFAPDAAAIRHCKQTLALPDNYILSVATFEPRKNLDRVLDAYMLLPLSLRRRYPLVLAGCSGWCNSRLAQRLAQLQEAHEIRVLGYVPQPLLPALYAGATLCVYASLYEGFGMPIAEAMACGTPVITSNCTAMPEVGGHAALLVHPQSTTEIAAAMTLLISNPDERERRRQLGLQQARQFSWDASARQLLDTLARCQELTP